MGKQDAGASAFNVPVGGTATALGVQNYAYALGSGGIITMTGIGDPNGAGMAGGVDSNIDEAQINSFTSENTPGSIQLGTSAGEVLVDFDAE